MKLVCNIITPAIESLAEKFGISKEYACTAVSVWQSLNNTSEYPAESQFKKYLQDNQKELEKLELAVPTYISHEFEKGKPLTWHENGTIHLSKLPSSNPLEYFFNKYGDEFRKYVRTTEEAYQVMLWNEMYNVQHNTNDNAESKNNALEKAKKYNEKHLLVISDYTQEMQDIKTKAIANGTFMKAPNGKPTNLNERQWLQVRTKAFKEWFGDWINDLDNASKVVDENGEPLVVYHGSTVNFNEFITEHKDEFTGELDEISAFFSTDKDYAAQYANPQLRSRGGTPTIYEVFLNVKNPDIRWEHPDPIWGEAALFRGDWKYAGNHDGIFGHDLVITNEMDIDRIIFNKPIKTELTPSKGFEIIVFNPNQIKSATNNTGTFSRENDDIRYNQSFPHPSLVRINKFKDDSPYSKKHAKNLQQIETVINALLDVNPRHIEVKSVTGEKRRIGVNRPFSNRKGTFLLIRGFDLNRPEDASKDTAYHPLEVRTIVENIFTEAKLKGYIDYNKKLSFRPFMTSKGEMVEVILEDMDDKELEEFEQYAYYIKGSEAADKFKEANAWNKLGEYTDPLLLKKFGNKRIVTVSELLNNLLKFNTKNKELVQLLQSVVGQVGNIELVLTPSYEIGQTLNGNEASAYYSPSANRIYVGSQSNFGGSADNTLLHEIIHALVYNMKKSDAQVQKLTDIYNRAVRLIENRLGKTLSEIVSKENKTEVAVGKTKGRIVKENWLYYGLTNVDEFVSELFTNPAFAHELNKVDEYNEKVNDEQYNIFEGFVQWIMDIFKSFFNEEYNSQLFYDAAKAVNELLLESGTLITHDNERKSLRGSVVYEHAMSAGTQENISEYVLHSGGANGADSIWEDVGVEYGLPKELEHVRHYYDRNDKYQPPRGNIEISGEDYEEGRIEAAKAAKYNYGYKYSAMKDLKIIRNWAQVKYSDTVFAVGYLAKPGDLLFPNKPGDTRKAEHETVQGGTGYAVAMAILHNKPVYVFDQGTRKWHIYKDGHFVETETPVLTKNFAGIGSRRITSFGKQAIRNVFEKTFGSRNQTNTPEVPQVNIDQLLPTKEFYDNTQPPVIPDNTEYMSPDDLDTFTDDMFEQDYDDMGLDALGLPDEASIKKSNEQRSITTEQANNPDNLPKPAPNTGSLNLNVPTEQKKLRSAYDVKTLNYRIEYLTSEFRDNINIAIDNKLQELADRDSNTNDEAEKAAIKKQVDLLNGGDIKDVISIIGFNEIFKMIRTKLQNELNMSEEGSYKNIELAKLLDNLLLLRKDVARQLDAFYGVRLNSNYEVIMSDDELEDEDTNFGDDDEGTRVAGSNDITGTKSRITNPFSTLSKKMRFALSNIMMVDSEGNPVYDDLGNPRYYNPNYLYRMILEESSQWRNADDFCVRTGNNVEDIDIVFINSLAKKHPWAEQLENIFYEDSTMASAFFHAFRLDFIHYGTQVEKDGILVSTYENVRPGFEGVYGRALEYYSEGIVLDKDSVYDTIGNIDKKHVDTAQSILEEVDLKQREDEFDTEYVNKMYKLFAMLGIKTDKYILKRLVDNGVENNYEDAVTIVNSIGNIVSNLKEANVEEGSFYHIIDENAADYKILAEKVGMIEETDNVQSFTDAERKKRYSFSTPNYCNTVIKYLTHPEDISRQNYIEEHYKKYEWFFNHTTGEWRTGWLGRLESDPYTRSLLSTYDMVSMDRIPYNEWTPEMMTTGFIREFYKTGWDGNAKVRSFRMPIPADSEVAMFITFEDIVGKDKICKELVNVVMQELYRMSVVENRKKNNASEITNFDSNGSKFNFIPELNDLKVDSEGNIDSNGQKFLDVCLNKSVTERENFILTTITQLEEQKFYAYMNKHFPVTQNGEFVDAGLAGWFAKNGMLKTKDDGSVDYNDFKNLIEHYWYNQIYATTQIVQIYTVDYAYYKDATDFQKRWKEIYASGHKLNTNSIYGKKTRKTVYISDDERTSTIYNEIKQVLDKAVKEGRIQTYDRDNILYKFRNVNTADAQCFVSLNAMKSILDMSTGWTDEMEAAFNRFKNGDWDMSDFNIVWQTLKPFMYTVIDSPDGLGGTMPVPHQNKNSEFLLMAAYTVVANSLQNNPKMVAIQKFMDDNDIDAIQFESAVKVGKQGVINLNYSRDKLDAYKANEKQWEKAKDKALKYLVKQFGEKKALKKFSAMNDYDKYKTYHDALLDEGGISQQEYNKAIKDMEPSMTEVYTILDKECRIQPDEADNASKKIYGVDEDGKPRKAGDLKANVVHELPYEDYMIQQPTPNHLFDNAEAVYGSQMRNLSISDMPDDPDFRVNINGESYTKQEVINLWNSIQIENLLEDYRELEGQIKTIDDFSKELIKMVRNNGKYSADLEEALTIVTNPDGTKGFKIPLTNPVTTLKIQQLALSLFKNRITKQKMRGGGAILVSDFGFTTELQIVRNKKGGVVGLECLLPATSEKFLKPFIKTSKDGTYKYLDINKMPEELRYAIGYRIPTEDKYSIAPLIIKGFLPQQNGSSIMLPMEITTLAGSDFDVDKMFLLLYEFGERKYDIKKAKEDFEKENKLTESLAKIFANETIDLEKITDVEWKDWWKENKDKYLLEKPQVYKIKYNTEKSSKDNNRKQRNNMLIDIMRGVLATPEIASMIFNPGNFDSLKCAANVLQVAQDKELLEKFMNKYGINSYNNAASALLQIIRTEDLATITDFIKDNSKPIDPLDPDTFIYFHQQNMVGAKLIGVYANNTTLHAKFQRTKLSIHNTDKITNTFIINGRTIDSLHNIDIEMKDGSKIRISKNCSQFSAASVDNVKDPVLAKLLQNGNTAEITCFMLRAGMTLEEISLIATSRIMRDLYLGYNENDIDNYVQTLTAQYNSFENKDPLENLNTHNFTSEEILGVLVNNTMNTQPTKYTVKQELMVARLVQHIIKQAQPFANVTKTGRTDSPNGAISHTIAGALLQIEAVRRLEIDDNKTLSGMASGVKNSVITPEMSDESVRKNLLNRPLPHLQAFYSFGIELPMGLLSSYFPQLAPKSLQVIQDIISELPTRALYSEKTRAILDKFFEAETVYGMSDTKMLGDDESQTYFEKLDWYINEFPKWFSKFKTAHPELASMGLFAKMRTENGKVIVKKSGELDQSIRDLYISQMDRLLDGDNLEYLELAERLFIYSYYTEGLHFGPNSIGQFFSSLFISQFSEAVQSMNDGINKMSEGQIEILNDLFINNNNLYTKIRIPEVKDRNGRVIPDPQSFSIIGKGDNIRYNIKADVVANKYNQRRPVLKYITVRVGNDVLDLKLDRYTSGSEYAIYKPANPIVGPYSIYNDNVEFGKKYEQILKNNQDDVPFAPDEAYYDDFMDSGVDDFAGIDFVSEGKTESNEINCQ